MDNSIYLAVALYRALISQSSAAPVNNAQRTALRNAVRKRFRDNKELQSSRQIELAFRTGYEVRNSKCLL